MDSDEVFDPNYEDDPYGDDLPAYFDPNYAKSRRYLAWRLWSKDQVDFNQPYSDANLKNVNPRVIDQVMDDLGYTPKHYTLDGGDGIWLIDKEKR